MPLHDVERHFIYLTATEGNLIGVTDLDATSRRFSCDELIGLRADVLRSAAWVQNGSYIEGSHDHLRAANELERLTFMAKALASIIVTDQLLH